MPHPNGRARKHGIPPEAPTSFPGYRCSARPHYLSASALGGILGVIDLAIPVAVWAEVFVVCCLVAAATLRGHDRRPDRPMKILAHAPHFVICDVPIPMTLDIIFNRWSAPDTHAYVRMAFVPLNPHVREATAEDTPPASSVSRAPQSTCHGRTGRSPPSRSIVSSSK